MERFEFEDVESQILVFPPRGRHVAYTRRTSTLAHGKREIYNREPNQCFFSSSLCVCVFVYRYKDIFRDQLPYTMCTKKGKTEAGI